MAIRKSLFVSLCLVLVLLPAIASLSRWEIPSEFPVVELPELVGTFAGEVVEVRVSRDRRLNDVPHWFHLDSVLGPPPNQLHDFWRDMFWLSERGHITIRLERAFRPGPGMDIRVYHGTEGWGLGDFARYPSRFRLEVSRDGEEWEYVGILGSSRSAIFAAVDLPDISGELEFLRLAVVDSGFYLIAIEALHVCEADQ